MIDRATVAVIPSVDAVLQELVDQIPVGGMHFDAIEAGRPGAARRGCIVIERAGDPRGIQRDRLRGVLEAVAGEGLAVGAYGTGRHGLCPVRQQRDMADAAHVPELAEDTPASGVHRFDDRLPSHDVGLGMDAGCVEVTLSHRRDLCGLGDDQASRRTLPVVGGRDGSRRAIGLGAVARQRCHQHAVGQFERADAQRGEQQTRIGHRG